jgi:hypothetical protein
MMPLVSVGYLSPSRTDSSWNRKPLAVGVGPGYDTWAVWSAYEDPTRRLVTRHTTSTEPDLAVEIDASVDCSFVQPMPHGHVLLVAARMRQGPNAQIWNLNGDLVRQGDFGDAIAHVLTTPGGAVWVGYFDEALGGSGPQSHGLARFNEALEFEWLYPLGESLPPVLDSYAMNVVAETAWVQSYTEFHLLRIQGNHAVDLGPVPRQGADNVILGGDRGALIGGYGPEHDLVTPIRLTPDGIVVDADPRRLVLPNGLDVWNARTTCRGSSLHVVIGTAKYRLELDNIPGIGERAIPH